MPRRTSVGSLLVIAAFTMSSTACSSDESTPSSADTTAGASARSFVCPTAGSVGTAVGLDVPDPRRSEQGTRTIACSYSGASSFVLVSVTFGQTDAEFETVPRALQGKTERVSGLGSAAIRVTDQGVTQLIVKADSRVVTVTLGRSADSPAHERNLAELVLG